MGGTGSGKSQLGPKVLTWLAVLLGLTSFVEVTVEADKELNLCSYDHRRDAGVLLDGIGDALTLWRHRDVLHGLRPCRLPTFTFLRAVFLRSARSAELLPNGLDRDIASRVAQGDQLRGAVEAHCRDGLPAFTATVDFVQKIPAPPKDERVVSGDLLKRGDGVHNLAGGRIFMPCGLPCHREFNGKARGIHREFDSPKGNSAFWSFRIMYYLHTGSTGSRHRVPLL